MEIVHCKLFQVLSVIIAFKKVIKWVCYFKCDVVWLKYFTTKVTRVHSWSIVSVLILVQLTIVTKID